MFVSMLKAEQVLFLPIFVVADFNLINTLKTPGFRLIQLPPKGNWTSSSSTNCSACIPLKNSPGQGMKFGWWQAIIITIKAVSIQRSAVSIFLLIADS
jgi:hypothetical protein